MADSSKAPEKGKRTTPAKPHATFPLFAHQTGRWAKKVRGRIRFYGRWGRSVGGKIIPVDDVNSSAATAQLEFDRCWPYHSQGREAPEIDDGDFLTIRDLANKFLANKKSRLDSGELSRQSFDDYFRTCQTLVDSFGAPRRVDDLTRRLKRLDRRARRTGNLDRSRANGLRKRIRDANAEGSLDCFH